MRNGTLKTWRTKKPVLEAAIVCQRNCNNGWMNAKLEGPMKMAVEGIILHNTHKKFTREECATIAAWGFKTTVLANHIHDPGDNAFFSVGQRRAFAQGLSMPRGVQVWIARRNAGYLTATFESRLLDSKPKPEQLSANSIILPYAFEIYCCVISIGYLLIQVTATKWAERKIADLLDNPSIATNQEFDGYAIPVWPNMNGFDWPPPHAIGNDLFPKFRGRFDKINIPARFTR